MAKFASKSNADGFRLDRIVLSELPADAYKIYATASARVYHTQFGASDQDWTYTRLKGILVFGRDRSAQGSPVSSISHPSPDADRFWFRLVDEISGKVVWMIKVPKVLDYQVDRPFFHVFPGRSRMFGFRFEDDDEAKALSQKVIDRIGPKAMKSRTTKKSKPLPAQPTHLATSMISSPKAFVHVAHVGINEKGVVEASKGLDPVWATLVGELKGHGVNNNIIQNNIDFIGGFLEGTKVSRSRTATGEGHKERSEKIRGKRATR